MTDSKDRLGEIVERIIDELIQYEFHNPHYQPRTMVELRERSIIQILALFATQTNLLDTLLEAMPKKVEVKGYNHLAGAIDYAIGYNKCLETITTIIKEMQK